MEHDGFELVFKLVRAGSCSHQIFGENWGSDDGASQGCDQWTDSDRDWPGTISCNVDLYDETCQYRSGEHYLSGWRHEAFSDSSVSVDNIEARIIDEGEMVKYFHLDEVNGAGYDK